MRIEAREGGGPRHIEFQILADRHGNRLSVRGAEGEVVRDVGVGPGEFVRKGQEMFRIESMKMQSSIAAPRDGVVESVFVASGETVETDQVLLSFAKDSG